MPTLLPLPAPLSPTSAAIPRVDSALRLSLHPVPNRRAVVDGAWWPYSRDAAAELPALIAAVDQRLGRTTLLVGVSRVAWRRVPSRIPARGRQVRVGCFRHGTPPVIVLFFAAHRPVALLVIPSDTAVGPAEAALKLTAQDTTGLSIDTLHGLAHLPPDPVPRARVDGSTRRENEGGSVTGQPDQSFARQPAKPH
ncbi:DUF5994 family protein [Nonomuraea typhae]|uniref:DUF5994 family protein n=1 Tax=Nonomuraea typhae TaxID=2603600 RepID=UPI0012FB3C31|nr:DUF5994 family protein [Nonomuraea typhae]